MNTKKILLSSTIISLIIVLAGIAGFYFLLQSYNFLPSNLKNLTPWMTKIINEKVIEENIQEKRTITDLQNDVIKSVKNAQESVVNIMIEQEFKVYHQDPYSFFGWHITERKEKVGWGSWIIISSDGYILTNKHVVQNPKANYKVITYNGETYQVDKIRLDPVLDIAVLKVLTEDGDAPTSLTPAKIQDLNQETKIGQFVIAIWNALSEFKNTATFGIISGKWRKLEANWTSSMYLWLYQTDAPINPGNSWGPLMNINWKVLWINTAITSVGQWIGFAIPVNKKFLTTTLEIIKEKWAIIRPLVGIEYINLDKSIAKNLDLKKFKWVYVKNVIKWGAAYKAGIEKGDIIMKINWKEIDKNLPFLYKIFTYKPWEVVDLTIFSQDDYKEIELKLWTRS